MANVVGSGRRWLLWAAAALAVLGVGLVALSAVTPRYTDANAYFDGLDRVRARLYDETEVGGPRFEQASGDFDALQQQYSTSKWLYADLGYSSLAWAWLAVCIAGINPSLTSDRRGWIVVSATFASVALLAIGVVASAFQMFWREQLPEWSDTLAIPLFSAIGFGLLLLPIVLSFSLAPLVFTRRNAGYLWCLRGRGWTTSVVVSLIYLPLFLLGLLALASFTQAGGWAMSVGGAILLWLVLNARAVWLGKRMNEPVLS